jgi:predicted nucleic acid-binding protein
VDSNVLLDVFTEDVDWLPWSARAIESAGSRGSLIVNPIVYAEVAVGFATIEELDQGLRSDFYEREPLPWEAAFLAGRAFLIYRRRGGARRSPLPDFYIGAHAAVRGYQLLTRDPKRYSKYFPTVELIAP